MSRFLFTFFPVTSGQLDGVVAVFEMLRADFAIFDTGGAFQAICEVPFRVSAAGIADISAAVAEHARVSCEERTYQVMLAAMRARRDFILIRCSRVHCRKIILG